MGPSGGAVDIARRVIDAGLHLLDRQLVDKDGRLSGKVDDLELTFPGGGIEGPPLVTAILSGPGALQGRFGPRLGGLIEAVHQRLHPKEEPGPARVSFGAVKRLAEHVDLTVAKGELDVSAFEDWVREHIVARIPGAAHASE